MNIGNPMTLDFSKLLSGDISRRTIVIKKNDAKRTMHLRLVNNSVAINLNNYTVKIYAIKPDAKTVFNNVSIVGAEDGEISIEITTQLTAVEGNVLCEIVLYNTDGVVASSAIFNIKVIDSLKDDAALESTNEFTALTVALNKVDTWDGQFETKYNGLEATYAEDLTGVKSQLADTTQQAISTVSHNIDKNTIVSFIDDDAHPDVWTKLKPIFESEGVPCTIAVITNRINTSSGLTIEQLNHLQNLGWTVCSHSHTHAYLGNIATEKDLEGEIKTAKDILNIHGFRGDILVYPYGSKSDLSLKTTRKHSVLGIGGYYEYNNMPIPTFELSRFAIDNMDTTNLSEYTSIVDNAPNNSWLIFYSHAGIGLTSQDKINAYHQLIQHVKSKNIEIVSVEEGLNRKGNIIDVGDKKKYFKVGRNGEIDSVQASYVVDADSSITNLTPLNYFQKNAISSHWIPYEQAYNVFPTGGGFLETHRGKNVSYGYQIWYPYNENTSLRRNWNITTNQWEVFEEVTKLKYKGTPRASTPLNDDKYFAPGTITYTRLTSAMATNMPENKAGLLVTDRLYSLESGYGFQLYHIYNESTIYKRVWLSSGTWGSWVKLVTNNEITSWAGSLSMKTSFVKLGITKALNFMEIGTIYSSGTSQPEIIKKVWSASEISSDSLNPTIIATMASISMQIYKDADNFIYIKNSASGQNHLMYFNISFC